jgi:L-asparaginase / beta-aspartyl-peptidase
MCYQVKPLIFYTQYFGKFDELFFMRSGTGTGEEFMKHVASYDVSCRMEMKGLRLDEVIKGLIVVIDMWMWISLTVRFLQAIEGTLTERLPPDSGGMIGVDKYGNHYMGFNCSGMFRGYCSSNGKAAVGIWEDEREVRLWL